VPSILHQHAPSQCFAKYELNAAADCRRTKKTTSRDRNNMSSSPTRLRHYQSFTLYLFSAICSTLNFLQQVHLATCLTTCEVRKQWLTTWRICVKFEDYTNKVLEPAWEVRLLRISFYTTNINANEQWNCEKWKKQPCSRTIHTGRWRQNKPRRRFCLRQSQLCTSHAQDRALQRTRSSRWNHRHLGRKHQQLDSFPLRLLEILERQSRFWEHYP